MGAELYITGKKVDLYGNEEIVGEYSIVELSNISKRAGLKTINFKLPATANNNDIFESIYELSSKSNYGRLRLEAKLLCEGIDMDITFAILQSVDGDYNVRLYGSNVDIYTLLKERMLNQLNYTQYDGFYNADRIAFLNISNTDIRFPIVDFNEDSPNAYIDNSSNEISVEVMLPSFKVDTLLTKIFAELGFTFENKIIEVPDLIICPENRKERDFNYEKYIAKFYSDIGPFPNGFPLTFTFDPFDRVDNSSFIVPYDRQYWVDDTMVIRPRTIKGNPSPYNNPNFCFADEVRIKYRLRFRIDTGGSVNSANCRIHFKSTSSENIYTRLAPSIAADYVIEDEMIIRQNDDGDVGLSIMFSTFPITNPTVVALHNEPQYTDFEILECEVLQPLDIRTKEESRNQNGFRYFSMAKMLPDMTQADFVKNYLLLFGGIIEVKNKHVTFEKYADSINDFPNGLDWSGKIDFSNKKKLTFDLGYAKLNSFKYKEQSGLPKVIDSDYIFEIPGDDLTPSKDLIELDFGASTNVQRLTLDFPLNRIELYEDAEITKSVAPRILIYVEKNIEVVFKNASDISSGSTVTWDVNVPFTRFIDINEIDNLGFGNNIYKKYHSYIEFIIRNSRAVECLIRLTPSDLVNRKFAKPIFIKEFDGWYFPNKIKFNYTNNESAIVELIKLI